uniref:GLIPR1-like protein 1 n=1 Tax=Ciona intestinalis TaxID=7719 RepID=UPI0002B8D8B4|nr:GLIPR1-like protein 1 [Ciona intestinalis]|eukprot:XP_004227533.1 GLIPR1-like protein 1 [Ciona intestinalis]
MKKLLVFVATLVFVRLTGGDNNPQPSVREATVMNEDEKLYALFMHNEARGRANPSASNMVRMIWDKALEQDAIEYSRKCIYEHDPDRSVGRKFNHVGENLYIGFPALGPKEFLKVSIDFWNNERFNYTFDTNECTLLCGHYTQMLWDDTFALGCGISLCNNIDAGDRVLDIGQLLVCRYGPAGNINNRRPYVRGTYCAVCPRDYWCEGNLCTRSAGRRLCVNYGFVMLLCMLVQLVCSLC